MVKTAVEALVTWATARIRVVALATSEDFQTEAVASEEVAAVRKVAASFKGVKTEVVELWEELDLATSEDFQTEAVASEEAAAVRKVAASFKGV